MAVHAESVFPVHGGMSSSQHLLSVFTINSRMQMQRYGAHTIWPKYSNFCFGLQLRRQSFAPGLWSVNEHQFTSEQNRPHVTDKNRNTDRDGCCVGRKSLLHCQCVAWPEQCSAEPPNCHHGRQLSSASPQQTHRDPAPSLCTSITSLCEWAGPTFSKLLRKILGRFLILGQSLQNIVQSKALVSN